MLNVQVKNYIIELKDGRNFNITEQQYKIYKMEQEDKKFNDSFEIIDIDTKQILFDGKWSEFKEFKERKINSTYEYSYYCDFGLTHPLYLIQTGNGCDCKLKFNTIGSMFQSRLREMGYEFLSAKNITNDMRDKYLQKFK